MAKFAVGEIALIAPAPPGHDNMYGFAPGEEVTIMEPLKIRRFNDGERHWCYIVRRGDDAHDYRARPSWLRKRPPKEQKRETLGEWELCPWRPSQATVS